MKGVWVEEFFVKGLCACVKVLCACERVVCV